MKAFLLALVASLTLAIAAAARLGKQQRSSAEAYSRESTRVGDPGENLVMESAQIPLNREDKAPR